MNESPEPDPLVFTPVPVLPCFDGWTPVRQRDFILALSVMGSVLHAVRAVGKTKQSAYAQRKRPGAESFAAAWDTALQMGYDSVFERAMERAVQGVVEPRYYKGKQVGTRRRYDYRLAFAAISEPRPRPQPVRQR
jgi:hypothetical protein